MRCIGNVNLYSAAIVLLVTSAAGWLATSGLLIRQQRPETDRCVGLMCNGEIGYTDCFAASAAVARDPPIMPPKIKQGSEKKWLTAR